MSLPKGLVKEWQKRLRLQDWRIKIEYLDGMKDNGDCGYLQEHKQASIRIANHPTDGYGEGTDHEQILVHELLHILFSPFEEMCLEEGKQANLDVEFTINTLAEALVGLRRASC